MLEVVKEAIANVSDQKFEDFYQDYVVASEKLIINHDVSVASREYTGIEDTCKLIQGLNKLTEELKFL